MIEISLGVKDLLGGLGWMVEQHIEVFPSACLQAGLDEAHALHVGKESLDAEKVGRTRKRGKLLELLGNHRFDKRSKGRQLPQFHPPGRLLNHGGRGISLHNGLPRARGIVIVAGAVEKLSRSQL